MPAAIRGRLEAEALEALRVGLLGKSGSITAQLKALGALPPDER
jgi:phenylalanyl-tRNA synthetase alpha chain